MNNVRKQSKLLAALLALLMVLSTVIALPVVADESATASENAGVTELWSADLSAISNTSGADNVKAALAASLGVTVANGSADITNGLLQPRKNTAMGPSADKNTFFHLLTGSFVFNGEVQTHTFVEFDYKFGSSNGTKGRDDTSTTVNGTTVTARTDFGDSGGANWNFRISGSEFIFRMSPANYLYTEDLATSLTSVVTGHDGYVYYEDTNYEGGKVYFDAKGYRYSTAAFEGAIQVGDKYYLDDPAGKTPTVSDMSLGSVLDPAKKDKAYQLERNILYRIGIDIQSTTKADGKVDVRHTVYIKKASAENWEKCVGTSEQTWNGTSTMTFTGSNGIYYGGNMVAYTCSADTHVEGMYTLTDKVSADGIAYQEISCSHCGQTALQKDGVKYTATDKGNACEGYKLWTAADGSGKMFVTDVVSGAHNYDGNGKCSKCATFEFLAEGFPKSGDPGKSVDTDNLSNVQAPYYDKNGGYIVAPNGGMLRVPLKLNDYNKPFVMSFNFCIDEKQENPDSTKDKWWSLVSYQSSAEGYLVYVRDDGDGLALTLGSQSFIHVKHSISYGEWYNISLAVDPATKHVIAYLNGEYFGMTQGRAVINASNSSAAFRIGINYATTTAYRFAFKVDDLNFYQLKDASEIYTTQASNVIASLKYDTNSYSRISDAMGKGTTTAFGTSSSSFRTSNIVDNKYGILSGTAYKEISLSTAFGDKEYNLSDKKYEIHIKFAVPSTDEDGTGMPDATETDSLNLVRLSKYDDPIQSVLMGRTQKGEYTANGKTLYDISGKSLSFVRDFDENGAPIGEASDLRVVVDEKNNVYSVYVDGCIAYYKEGSTLVPFMNVTMPYAKGDVKDEVSSYGEITKEMANNAGYTKFAYQYLRVFRDIKTVAVEELTISLVGDRDVEFVGAQVKTADQGAAAETFDLRFLFGLDDLFSDSVGFQIKAYKNGVQVGNTYETSVENEIKTVSKSVNAANGHFDTFSAFETDKGHYLAAFKITGIEETNSNDVYRFEIVPYTRAVSPAHDVEEATKVCADTVYVVCCDGLGNNVFTQAIDNN